MEPDLERTLDALGSPQRRAIIQALRDGPRSVGELARELGLNLPSASKQVQYLRKAGVLEQQVSSDDARVRTMHLRRQAFDQLRSWLDDVEAAWTEQLDSFKDHAERAYGKRTR